MALSLVNLTSVNLKEVVALQIRFRLGRGLVEIDVSDPRYN